MFVLRFTAEQGRPVNRPLYAKIGRSKVAGIGVVPSWKLVETPADATSWATIETATKHQQAHTSDYYVFEIEEI